MNIQTGRQSDVLLLLYKCIQIQCTTGYNRVLFSMLINRRGMTVTVCRCTDPMYTGDRCDQHDFPDLQLLDGKQHFTISTGRLQVHYRYSTGMVQVCCCDCFLFVVMLEWDFSGN